MNEADWLACRDPGPMLVFLKGRASDRKLRLFAVACCRRLLHILSDESSRAAVEAAERYADGRAEDGDIHAALQKHYDYARTLAPYTPEYVAAWALNHVAGPSAWTAAWQAEGEARRAVGLRGGGNQTEGQAQAALLREVFGNPFRPATVSAVWLAWNDRIIPLLAQAIHNDRAFDRLPILADALEEAGCTDEEMLRHLHGPGPHTRGCWVLDLLLGLASWRGNPPDQA